MPRYCEFPLPLVGASLWLPSELFEFSWSSRVGCNRLACEACGGSVRAQVSLMRPNDRDYTCDCQQIAVSHTTYVGEPFNSHRAPLVDHWECTGHPNLTLPAVVDGITLSRSTDWSAITAQGLLDPPFAVPGYSWTPIWLVRLGRLLSDEADRERLVTAATRHLESDDPLLVHGVLKFYEEGGGIPDLETLREVVDRRVKWLRATPDPANSSRRLITMARQTIARTASIIDGQNIDK